MAYPGMYEPTPWQVARDRAEQAGDWPEAWGPHHCHRHFASDAIHRDGGPECDQPGTPRRVYVFDAEYLHQHELAVAQWAVAHPDQFRLPRLAWQPGEETMKPARMTVRIENDDGTWSEAAWERPDLDVTVGHSLMAAYQATYRVTYCNTVSTSSSGDQAAGYFRPSRLEGQQRL